MLYFDESGNSGGNLLDKLQPCYSLLSHNFSKDETQELLARLQSLSNAKELHFKNLKKYPKFKDAIIECLKHDLIQKDRVYFYYAHKPFMIGVQIVDQLIEPVMYEHGFNIYKTGYNIATSNMFYLMGTRLWDKLKFENMCNLFVRWTKANTEESCTAFYNSVDELYSVTKAEDGEILEMILASQRHLKSITSAFSTYSLDVTLSCFNAHCNFWAGIYGKPFDITFDNSKQIDYWRDMIDFMTHNLPSAEVGYGSRKHKYPLLINSLITRDSKDCHELQLADVLASSVNYLAIQIINDTQDDFSRQILSSKLFTSASGNSLWPGTEMSAQELDMTDDRGIDPLNFIAKAAKENPEKYKKSYRK